MLENSWVFKDS